MPDEATTPEIVQKINNEELLTLGYDGQYEKGAEFILNPKETPVNSEILKQLQKSPKEIGLIETDGVLTVVIGGVHETNFGDEIRTSNARIQVHTHTSGKGRPSPGDYYNVDLNGHQTIAMIIHAQGVVIYQRPQEGWARDKFGNFLARKGYSLVGAVGNLKATTELTETQKDQFLMEFGLAEGIIKEQIAWEDSENIQWVVDMINLEEQALDKFHQKHTPKQPEQPSAQTEVQKKLGDPGFKWLG